MRAKQPPFREIFDNYAPFMWRALRHLGVPERDIEDVCQEVFVVAHRKLSGFEGRSSLRTWLYGIWVRVAHDYRRGACVRREVVTAEPPERVVGPTQVRQRSYEGHERLLETLLDRLDEDKRTVFVLYELEELSMAEVAEVVGCPLQTGYWRLHSARDVVLRAARELEHETGR